MTQNEADKQAWAEAFEPPVLLVGRAGAAGQIRERARRVRTRRCLAGSGALAALALGGVFIVPVATGFGRSGGENAAPAAAPATSPSSGSAGRLEAAVPALPYPSATFSVTSSPGRDSSAGEVLASTGPTRLGTQLIGSPPCPAGVARCRHPEGTLVRIDVVEDLQLRHGDGGYEVVVIVQPADLDRMLALSRPQGVAGAVLSVGGEPRLLLESGQLGRVVPLVQSVSWEDAESLVAVLQPEAPMRSQAG